MWSSSLRRGARQQAGHPAGFAEFENPARQPVQFVALDGAQDAGVGSTLRLGEQVAALLDLGQALQRIAQVGGLKLAVSLGQDAGTVADAGHELAEVLGLKL